MTPKALAVLLAAAALAVDDEAAQVAWGAALVGISAAYAEAALDTAYGFGMLRCCSTPP